MAIRDTKLVEAICLFLIKKNMISVQKRPSRSELLTMILDVFLKYDYFDRSKPPKSDEVPREFRRYLEVDFDEETCANDSVPKYLLRKQNEVYDSYLSRTTEYLKDLSSDRLHEILGHLNPSLERNAPAIDLMLKIIKSKKSSSIDSCGCIIF